MEVSLTYKCTSTSLKNFLIKITYPTQHPNVKKNIKNEINFDILSPKTFNAKSKLLIIIFTLIIYGI